MLKVLNTYALQKTLTCCSVVNCYTLISTVYIITATVVIFHRFVATENLALKKPTMQNDETTSYVKSAKGVDGIARKNETMTTYVKTLGISSSEWWMVDLRSVYDISHVVITNLDHATCKYTAHTIVLRRSHRMSVNFLQNKCALGYPICHRVNSA